MARRLGCVGLLLERMVFCFLSLFLGLTRSLGFDDLAFGRGGVFTLTGSFCGIDSKVGMSGLVVGGFGFFLYLYLWA